MKKISADDSHLIITLKLSISDKSDRLCILAHNNVAYSLEPKLIHKVVCWSSISSVIDETFLNS